MYLTHGNLHPWKSATKQRLQKMFIRKTRHYKRAKQIVQDTCSFWYNAENKKSLQIQVTHPPEPTRGTSMLRPLAMKGRHWGPSGSQPILGYFTFPAEVQIVHRALMALQTKLLHRNSYIQVGALIYCIS